MWSTNHRNLNEISASLLISTLSNNFNLFRAKDKVGQPFGKQLMLT